MHLQQQLYNIICIANTVHNAAINRILTTKSHHFSHFHRLIRNIFRRHERNIFPLNSSLIIDRNEFNTNRARPLHLNLTPNRHFNFLKNFIKYTQQNIYAFKKQILTHFREALSWYIFQTYPTSSLACFFHIFTHPSIHLLILKSWKLHP